MTAPTAVPEAVEKMVERLNLAAVQWQNRELCQEAAALLQSTAEAQATERERANAAMTLMLATGEALREAQKERDDALTCWAGLNQQFQDNLEALKSTEEALEEARRERDGTLTTNRLAHELDGVIADVTQGGGFDDVCLRTIQRVRDALLGVREKRYDAGVQVVRLAEQNAALAQRAIAAEALSSRQSAVIRELVRIEDFRRALEDEHPAYQSDNWPIDHEECLRDLDVAWDAARALLAEPGKGEGHG